MDNHGLKHTDELFTFYVFLANGEVVTIQASDHDEAFFLVKRDRGVKDRPVLVTEVGVCQE